MSRSKKNEMHDEHWIEKAIQHPGALRRKLDVKEGHKIPESKLTKAMHSANPTVKKEALLANTLRKMHNR